MSLLWDVRHKWVKRILCGERFSKRNTLKSSNPWANSAGSKLMIFFYFFPRKLDLAFHANCLQWRQFAWNVKSCFLGKIRKICQNVMKTWFYPECYAFITKPYLYNFDPLKPHFYIVKLGFTGVYIIFLISAQKHRMWVFVRTASPRRF